MFETRKWQLRVRSVSVGSLTDLATGRLLGMGAVAAIVAWLVLVALDPPGDVAVLAFERAEGADISRILSAWEQTDALDRVFEFVVVDALIFAPVLALMLLASWHRMRHLQMADHPAPRGRPSLPDSLLAIIVDLLFPLVVLAAVICNWLGDLYVVLQAIHAKVAHQFAGPVINELKFVFYAIAAAVAALLFLRWYFSTDPAARGHVSERASLRSGVADVIWRTKYSTSVVAVFGALTVGMDQARDTLIRQSPETLLDGTVRAQASIVGFIVTMLAVTLLAWACYHWACRIVRLRTPGRQAALGRSVQTFALWWCRLIGMTPFLLVGALLAITLRGMALRTATAHWLLALAGMDAAFALIFLFLLVARDWGRLEAPYDATDVDASRAFAARASTFVLGWSAPLLFLLARWFSLSGWTPPLATAVIAGGLATWAVVLGWVALASRRNSIPYVFGFVGILVAMGILGWAEVGRIRTVSDSAAIGLHDLFFWALWLALPCLLLGLWLSHHRRPSWGSALMALLLFLPWTGSLIWNDRSMPRRDPVALGRPDLETATSRWLQSVDTAVRGDTGKTFSVYLVSAEGGGARSAYWTAQVLLGLHRTVPDFEKRTLSLAGVSGGALGIAAYRACQIEQGDDDPQRVESCVRGFSATDLWTQLLGGLLFEDAVASVLPTSLICPRSPGCGVLGRAYWFEGSMEASVRTLGKGLVQSAQGGDRPHLFLTSTRVETGERWIHSDVMIKPADFPGACDVLAVLGDDVKLSTAAHDSARFPYTNPVGALYGATCALAATGSQPAARLSTNAASRLRARLQDGGYFDDSAASTSVDLLRMVRRCLDGGCPSLEAGVATRLRPRLRLTVILIRNEDTFEDGLAGEREPDCIGGRLDPAMPVEAPASRLLPSVLSAGLTLFQTRTAHMHASEAVLEAEAQGLWTELDPPDLHPEDHAPIALTHCLTAWKPASAHAAWDFQLMRDASLYPSGWVLSPEAMAGIRRQANRAFGPPLPSVTPPSAH